MLNLLKKLSLEFGPTGYEKPVREMIIKELEPYSSHFEAYVDKLGAYIVRFKNEGAPKLMISAHMDEVGMMITDICDDGRLRFGTVGGIVPIVLLSKRVISENGVMGSIISKPVHLQSDSERKEAPKIKDLYIDIGADTKAEAEALWNTFKAQIEEAKASAEAYAALQAKLEQAYVWGEEGLSEAVTEFEAAVAAAEKIYEEAPLNVEATRAALVTLDNAIFDFFMANADGELEYDMTDLHVVNPTVRSNNLGWTYNPEGTKAVVGSNIAEFFNVDYDMSQTIEGLPNGMYVVYMTGYYRASSNNDNIGFNAHEAGTETNRS